MRARASRDLALGSAAFAAAIVVSFLTHLSIPFVIEPSLVSVYAIALTYAALSVPFVFSGIVVSIALTQFPRQVSALYGADLAGAALGCVLVGPVLRLTDGADGRPGHVGGRRLVAARCLRRSCRRAGSSAAAPPWRCC